MKDALARRQLFQGIAGLAHLGRDHGVGQAFERRLAVARDRDQPGVLDLTNLLSLSNCSFRLSIGFRLGDG
jgi:hypothetical protein